MVRWICFGVGVNNFAHDRVAMRAVIAQLGEFDSVTSYGATGNLVVASSLSERELAERFDELTRRRWAVLPLAQVARYVEEIAEKALPF